MSQILFSFKQRVYYEDTDATGIVYHANYLKFMERARSEWLWSLGMCFDDFAKQDTAFAIHHASLDYHKPLRLKDEFLATCNINNHRRTSMTFDQSIISTTDPNLIYCSGQIRLVCITLDGKPKPLPTELLEKAT